MRTLIATAFSLLGVCSAHSSEYGESQTLSRILERSAISLGYREYSIPFSYLDGSGSPIGYSMDLCHIITDGIMKKVEKSIKINLVPVSNTSRLPLIANGTIDIECGNTTNNLDRQKIVSFSNTIYLTASTFMSRAGDGVRTIADLAKRRVSSPAGSTNIEQLYRENKNRSLSISVLPAKDNAEGFLMLESHRIDAFVQDDIVLAGVIATSKAPSEYTISTDRFSEPEPYGLTLPRGDVIFKSMVDGILSDYFQSPAGVETYNKWFTSSIPYKNINLNTPMSTELKNSYNHPSDQAGPGSYR